MFIYILGICCVFGVSINDESCPYTDDIYVTPKKGMLYVEYTVNLPGINASDIFTNPVVNVTEGKSRLVLYLFNDTQPCRFRIRANRGKDANCPFDI